MSRPKIAVTMGDPAGVGPEICLELLQNKQVADLCIPIVFGDSGVLNRCAEKVGRALPGTILGLTELATSNTPSVCDLNAIALDQFSPGTACPATGKATLALKYFVASRAPLAALKYKL